MGGGRAGRKPPRLVRKQFFCMSECAKTQVHQHRISKFPREHPQTSRGGEEREGKGKEGGRGRIGRGGTQCSNYMQARVCRAPSLLVRAPILSEIFGV